MPLSRTAAPAALLSLAEIKAHVRVDHADDDTLLTALAAAAVGHLDGASGVLGRALVRQSWRLTRDAWPADGVVRLPLPPLHAVTAVRAMDAALSYQTLSAATYVVARGGDWGGTVRPAADTVWPDLPAHPEAVQIDFDAGWTTATEVPAPIRHAALLLTALWYENREPVITGTIVASLPMTVDALLAPWRLMPV
jgi:uncharacterized phiE125 gp8 family phage protein